MTRTERRTQLRGSVDRWILSPLARHTGLSSAVAVIVLVGGLVVAAAGAAFTVTLEDAMEGDGVAGADPAVRNFFLRNRTTELTGLFRAITRLGSATIVIGLVVLVAALLLWQHERVLAFGLVLATGGTAVLVAAVKLAVDRSRPPIVHELAAAGGSSFPSGHAAEAVACYGALAWILVRRVPLRRARVPISIAAGSIGLAVGISRVYLGVHWASDVLGGWSIGIMWLTVSIAICTALPHYEPPGSA